MKVTKKLLSVFLALVMLMTSMSVCFGTVANAAGGNATDAQWNALADALANDTIKDADFSGTAHNYTVDDPDGKVLTAIEAYYAVFNAIANRSPACGNPSNDTNVTGSSEGNRTINQVNTSIKTEIASRMGGDYSAYNVDAFLTGLLAGANVSGGTGDQKGGRDTTNDSSAPGTNLNAIGDIKLTVTMASAVTGFATPDELPDNVVTSKSFTVKHTNANYDYTYKKETVSEGSGCNKKDVDYYSEYYKYFYNISAAVSAVDGASVSTQTIKTTASTLSTYADYFSMDLDALVAVFDATTLSTVKTAVVNAKANVTGSFGATVYNHFFSSYNVETLSANIDKAVKIIAAANVALELNALLEAGYDSIITDKGALETLAQDVKTFADKYDAYESDVKEYVESHEYEGKTFNRAAVTAFRDAILREIELIELRALKATIETDIVPFLGYNEENVADRTVSGTDLNLAKGTVDGWMASLDTYADANVAEVWEGEDIDAYLASFSENLENLITINGYTDDFANRYAYYVETVYANTNVDADSEELFGAVESYDSWYTGLKALIAEIEAELDEDIAQIIIDDLDKEMKAHLDSKYNALHERVFAQIDLADVLYKEIIGTGGQATVINLSTFAKFEEALGHVEVALYNFLLDSPNFDMPQKTIDEFEEIWKLALEDYYNFLESGGFDRYEQTLIADLERPDSEEDIARENENGVYKTSDADIEKIIKNIDALLQNDEVKKLLGDLINKDKETGEPTGEPFSLSTLITGLLEDSVYTDSLINTIIQFVYPLVAKEFAKVWAGLPATMTIEDVDTGFFGITADVTADLSLDDVETAIASVGVFLAPSTLAKNLQNAYGKNSGEYAKYTDAISVLKSATTKAVYSLNGDGDEDDTFINPWDDPNLFENVYDEETGEQVFNDDGTPKQVYKINWGVDEAEDKRAAFVDAACAALSGLEPLLFGILTNHTQANANDSDGTPRGAKIGTGSGYAKVVIDLNLVIDPITLVLKFSGNDGYDNALAPIFEALGLKNIPHSEDLTTTRKILEDGLFGMIDQLIDKLDEAPVTFLLNALPNLCYALEGGLITPLLGMLRTEINYYADAQYSVIGLINGSMPNAMKSEEPIIVDLGEMINLEDMGLDLSFSGIWSMISGMLPEGITLPELKAGLIATLGELKWKDTNRTAWTYTPVESGKAAYIQANKADVLVYLLKYVLGSGLINSLVEAPEGVLADILTSLGENPDTILAAVVELLNQKKYDTLREFEWFNGLINNESVVDKSAQNIYLNPANDWTEDKADYLYKNLDSIVAAVTKMAGADFDLGALIDDLFTNETVTALAKLLGKLGDINGLIAGGNAEEETETPDEPEVIAEGEEGEDATEGTEEEKAALDIDVAALIKEFLGVDLSAYADYANIAEDEVIDFGVTDAETFAAALTDLLAPFKPVLDFILAGEDLEIKLSADEKVTLVGYNSYNNAIIPLLEALGCDAAAFKDGDNALELILDALVGKIETITEAPIKAIIDILPGVFYFIASKGLSVSVRNILQPVYVILDTIRPVYDLNLNDLINSLLPEDFGMTLNIDDIGLEFVFDLLKKIVPDLDLSALKDLIYDICLATATEYDSASTLQTEWKKGAYGDFSQADLLTVVLSFLLEWATIEDNAKALDEMLGTDGIIASINKVFADVEIAYGTPNWMYWFSTEEEFNSYVEGTTALPNTLAMLTYPNDWSDESAQYIADNLASLVDMVIGLIEIDGTKYASVSELIGAKLDVFNAETINSIIALITDLLAEVDDNLLGLGYLLDVDIVGLKNYECTAEITDVKSFAAELASILTTYAGSLVNWLFFGDDFRFAKKSDKTDTIVIDGGLGYEKGLALVLEALGCDLPDEATVENILLALATRVEEILDAPVNEVIDLLPNLVYFLNANGASVAVNNLLAPVYALLDKINGLGVLEEPIDLAALLGFDLKYLSLADILALVKDKTGLDLKAAEEILVNLCFGKIEKAEYTYKMVADRKDVITVVLTTALLLVKDADFAAKLEELLGTDVISAISKVFESAPVTYKTPEWYALDENDIDYDNETIGVIEKAIEYPNNWTEESAKYIADNLGSIGDMAAGIIDSNYDSLGALLKDKANLYTEDNLKAIQTLLGDLIAGLDENLKDIVNVGLGAADALLGADVQGLLDYDVSSVKDKETFVAALTGMLMEVEGLIDWLLLGEDYNLFVDDKNDNGTYDKGEQIITLNGGHGYAEGLALILEALGVEGLPEVYGEDEIDTQAVVGGVLSATFSRVDAILANPVDEVFNLLPNVLYFINANGLTVAVENLLGAVNALLIKLEPIVGEFSIVSLVNFSDILGVETELALDNITMEAVIKVVAELTGLNLDKIADVLVGFALGRVAKYDSVSSAGFGGKMYYHDDFAKYDMITAIATVVILTVLDDANADKLKEMLGEDIYQLILNLVNMGEVAVQEFNWQFTDKADTDYIFSAISTSEILQNHQYGALYTYDMSQFIADNFGDFVDNVIYLLGVDVNGDGGSEKDIKELINSFLGGSLYTSSNVIAVRDALAGILENLTKLEVNGKVVGGVIADVLKTTGIADIAAVAEVDVPEFSEDRTMFVSALCDVLEPIYGILKYVLADEDISFFVNAEKTDAITLKGAEGYAYGIIPLLEALGCKNILTPAEYYAAVEADGAVLLTSILNPLFDRVDEILKDDPAQAILDMLPNLIYFVNSNGVDTVVKNTLNAVFALLSAIEPVAKIDIYELIGVDLATIDFQWLFAKLLEIVKNATGYEFSALDANAILELTTGTLESYTSANGNTAYRMVYAPMEELSGGKVEMVTVVERLIITFIVHENNQELLLGLLRDYLGMSEEAEPYIASIIEMFANLAVETQLGMDTALATIYYIFYGIDAGVDGATGGMNELNGLWKDALEELRENNAPAADMIEEILGWDIFEDVLDPYDGVAPNGIIAFVKKIVSWFQAILDWFRGLGK